MKFGKVSKRALNNPISMIDCEIFKDRSQFKFDRFKLSTPSGNMSMLYLKLVEWPKKSLMQV